MVPSWALRWMVTTAAMFHGVASLLLITFLPVLAVVPKPPYQKPLPSGHHSYVVALLYIPVYVLMYQLFGADLSLLAFICRCWWWNLPLSSVWNLLSWSLSAAFRHGFNNSLGMCALCLIVGCLRELLATGAVFGNQMIHAARRCVAGGTASG